MEFKTRVVNLRKEPYDVYIGRPGKWGNPFPITTKRTRVEAIAQYHKWILAEGAFLLNDLHELKGKRLGCFCSPLPCHGDVLIQLLGE